MAVQRARRTRGLRPKSESSQRPQQVRLALICALFAGCVLVLVWRLFTFQVLDTQHYQQLAEDERNAEIPITPVRGALLDTNGNPLSLSVRYDSVYVLGSLVASPARADKVAATLSPILNVPVDQLRAAIDPKSGVLDITIQECLTIPRAACQWC